MKKIFSLLLASVLLSVFALTGCGGGGGTTTTAAGGETTTAATSLNNSFIGTATTTHVEGDVLKYIIVTVNEDDPIAAEYPTVKVTYDSTYTSLTSVEIMSEVKISYDEIVTGSEGPETKNAKIEIYEPEPGTTSASDERLRSAPKLSLTIDNSSLELGYISVDWSYSGIGGGNIESFSAGHPLLARYADRMTSVSISAEEAACAYSFTNGVDPVTLEILEYNDEDQGAEDVESIQGAAVAYENGSFTVKAGYIYSVKASWEGDGLTKGEATYYFHIIPAA